jgi:Protein of unknown function (DUF1878)
MKEKDLLERIEILEFHMALMAEAMDRPGYEFNKLIIAKSLSKKETDHLLSLCEKMNKAMEEQKAEGFLYFHPLFREFSTLLPSKTNPGEVVLACIGQKLFVPLMDEFKKFL